MRPPPRRGGRTLASFDTRWQTDLPLSEGETREGRSGSAALSAALRARRGSHAWLRSSSPVTPVRQAALRSPCPTTRRPAATVAGTTVAAAQARRAARTTDDEPRSGAGPDAGCARRRRPRSRRRGALRAPSTAAASPPTPRSSAATTTVVRTAPRTTPSVRHEARCTRRRGAARPVREGAGVEGREGRSVEEAGAGPPSLPRPLCASRTTPSGWRCPVGALIVGRPDRGPDTGLLVLAALLLATAAAGALVLGVAARSARATHDRAPPRSPLVPRRALRRGRAARARRRRAGTARPRAATAAAAAAGSGRRSRVTWVVRPGGRHVDERLRRGGGLGGHGRHGTSRARSRTGGPFYGNSVTVQKDSSPPADRTRALSREPGRRRVVHEAHLGLASAATTGPPGSRRAAGAARTAGLTAARSPSAAPAPTTPATP